MEDLASDDSTGGVGGAGGPADTAGSISIGGFTYGYVSPTECGQYPTRGWGGLVAVVAQTPGGA